MESRPKRAKTMKMEYELNGKSVSKERGRALATAASYSLRNRVEISHLERRASRITGSPERLSVQRAMLAVEDKLVQAFWVLARLPNDRGVGYASRHGVDYMMDRVDKWGAAVAGGGWLTEAPRPSPPRASSIDAMHEPLGWLCHLDRSTARLVTVAAQSKRGDTAANISWGRVRATLPEVATYSTNRLHRVYRDGLRTIVNELTLARMQ